MGSDRPLWRVCKKSLDMGDRIGPRSSDTSFENSGLAWVIANARPLFRNLQPQRIAMERNMDPRFDVVTTRPDIGYRATLIWQAVLAPDQQWHQFISGPGAETPILALIALLVETVQLLSTTRGWLAPLRQDFETLVTFQNGCTVTMDIAIAQSTAWNQTGGQGPGAGTGLASAPSSGAAPPTQQAPSGAAAGLNPSQAANENDAQVSHAASISNAPGHQPYASRPHHPHPEQRAPAAASANEATAPRPVRATNVKQETSSSDDEMST
ncbi:hypothetical protein B0A48_15385 [Cryoendolithus antarcticus]|uniref:Uncharacterized protein n=1 Tax=Cryoendolithus antarcticus TaxID=1507870 RepID=A0A1V8SI13_9PEZI|nr:hypothetical protein B0A48_15385 [Cryoendolithus antarcticus]